MVRRSHAVPRKRLPPDQRYPAGLPELETRILELPSGLRIRVVHGGPACGPPVLLLHGWGGSLYQFRKNIPALAAAGFSVYAMDFPGHGSSDKPRDPAVYTLESLSRAAVDVLDALRVESASLVGQSLGGAVAVRLSLDHPERVRRVATISTVGLASPLLVTTFGRYVPAIVAGVLPPLVLRPVVRAILRSAVGGPERPDARDVDEVWAASAEPGYAAALLHLVRGVRWRAPAREELRRIRVPVLVISGERDLIAAPRRLRRTLAELPRIQLVVIPRGGHAVNEGNPGAVNPLLVKFLKEGVAHGAATA